MGHGTLLPIVDGIGAIAFNVLTTTMGTSYLRYAHVMRSPQTIRMFLSGDLDFLQLSCPATLLVSAYDIKRNQCPCVIVRKNWLGS
jgi:hypothetical protein